MTSNNLKIHQKTQNLSKIKTFLECISTILGKEKDKEHLYGTPFIEKNLFTSKSNFFMVEININ